MKRLTTIISMLAVAGTFTAAASADGLPQGGGANNVVLSSAGTDGAFSEQARTQVTQTGSPTIMSANIANATAAGCTGCDATAVAVQAVAFTGTPSDFAPANVAVGTTAGCTGCGAFAYAWQYLLQVDRPFTLTGDEQQQVAALRAQIDATAASILPDSFDHDALLNLELDALTSQLKDLINSAAANAGAQVTGPPVERRSVETQ